MTAATTHSKEPQNEVRVSVHNREYVVKSVNGQHKTMAVCRRVRKNGQVVESLRFMLPGTSLWNAAIVQAKRAQNPPTRSPVEMGKASSVDEETTVRVTINGREYRVTSLNGQHKTVSIHQRVSKDGTVFESFRRIRPESSLSIAAIVKAKGRKPA